jgi:hypothetical protein
MSSSVFLTLTILDAEREVSMVAPLLPPDGENVLLFRHVLILPFFVKLRH